MATFAEVREFLGVEMEGVEGDLVRVGGFGGADRGTLVFATNAGALEDALASGAGLILGPAGSGGDGRVVAVKEPRVAFARVYRRWFAAGVRAGVHGSSVIGEDVVMGAGCAVGPGCVVGDGVVMGEGCVLGARVVVEAGTTLGARVVVQAGAVLGAAGFGYVLDARRYVGFPQIGTLWVGDDVEIGAGTTIDRGALGETRIGRGTKIDNLVHIAHNCRIGEDVLIAAQVGLAGSCVIEDGAMLGGQVGLGERVTIGRGVILGGQGGVLPGKRIDGAGEVFWGTPARPVREYLRDVARMRRR